MRTFVSQNGLAKRLRRSENFTAARIRALAIEPDGVLIQESGRDTMLFATENVPALRALFNSKPTEALIQ